MTRRSLLLLSHRLPFPPHGEATPLTPQHLSACSRTCRSPRVMLRPRVDSATGRMSSLADRMSAMAEFGTFEVFPIPQHGHRLRFLADHVRSVVRQVPYTYYVHDSMPFERRLRALLGEKKFSLAHVESMDLVRFIPMLASLPVVCTHHNVESSLLRRRAANEQSPITRNYLALQASLLEQAEREWLPRVALNIAVSDADRDTLLGFAPGARVVTIPNGVDTDFFTPGTVANPEGCVFVGGTTWYPNRDALKWYVSSVAPALRAIGVSAPTTWVGRASDEELRRFANDPSLHLTGYVDDVRPFVHRAKCFIVPLRVGGGTRLKILDAWAMGAAVVSTSIGCEGLAAVDGPEEHRHRRHSRRLRGRCCRACFMTMSSGRTIAANARQNRARNGMAGTYSVWPCAACTLG